MKVKNLIKKLYSSIINGHKDLEKKIYEKITRKSLKHKRTHAVK
jgi:hypothetical protein